MNSSTSKDFWDKAQTLAAVVASIFVPLAALVVGNWVTSAQKESENRVKYLELAVSVLRTEPTQTTMALRQWAIEVLSAQSPVPVLVAMRDELREQQVNLSVGYGTSYGWGYTNMDSAYPPAPRASRAR